MFDKVSLAPSLSDQVTEALLSRIESGRLKPGEKLPPEAALASEFGVSRTVVREAISRLKQEGLVESRQGSGVFVRLQPAINSLKIDDSVLESRESSGCTVDSAGYPGFPVRCAVFVPLRVNDSPRRTLWFVRAPGASGRRPTPWPSPRWARKEERDEGEDGLH